MLQAPELGNILPQVQPYTNALFNLTGRLLGETTPLDVVETSILCGLALFIGIGVSIMVIKGLRNRGPDGSVHIDCE